MCHEIQAGRGYSFDDVRLRLQVVSVQYEPELEANRTDHMIHRRFFFFPPLILFSTLLGYAALSKTCL